MSYDFSSVYERMTDTELEYSLERASGKLEEGVQRYMAALYLQDSNGSSCFDRLAWRMDRPYAVET